MKASPPTTPPAIAPASDFPPLPEEVGEDVLEVPDPVVVEDALVELEGEEDSGRSKEYVVVRSL